MTKFSDVALSLFDAGYPVLPAHGKKILIDDWAAMQIDRPTVEYWVSNGQASANTGIRCGEVTMADIDITDKDVARVVAASVEEHFGATIERRGMAPKRGLIYSMDGQWGKVQVKLTDPTGKVHKVEWLAKGQQFIAYGIHPDTGKPYTYRDRGLLEVEPWELPTVTEADVCAWMRDVLPGLLPEDWVIGNAGGGAASDQPADAEERALLNFKARLEMDWDEVKKCVMCLDADVSRDEWYRVLMAIHHQSGGSDDGLDLADEWSKSGTKYKGRRDVAAVWRSIDNDPSRGRIVTMASVIKMARETDKWKELERAEKVEALAGWLDKIADCQDAHDLQTMAKGDIACDNFVTDVDRMQIIAALQARAQELTGVRPTKDIVTKWVKRRGRNPLPDISSDGYPLQTAKNLATMCANLDVTIRYNVITKEDEILIPLESWSDDNRANASLAWMIDAAHREEMRSTNIKDFVTMLADQNLFNPVMTWVKSSPWDGVSRLAQFYGTVRERVGEIAPGLKEVLMLRWLVTAIKAAADPMGVAAQGVLVFQGVQYAGKTRWLKSLAPSTLRLIHEGLTLDPKNKDSVKIAISHWIVELGELDSTFRKADISALKAFITQPFDILRKPFAKTESHFARRTVFGASVNDEQFLQDPTGNRRFWTIPVESVTHEHGIDMQQVWAEVYELYKKGEKHYLTPEEMALLNEHNLSFTVVNPIAELLSTQLDWENFDINNCRWMTASDVLRWLDQKNPSRFDCTEAGRQITKLAGKITRRSNGHHLRPVPLRRKYVNDLGDEGRGTGEAGVQDLMSDPLEEIPF